MSERDEAELEADAVELEGEDDDGEEGEDGSPVAVVAPKAGSQPFSRRTGIAVVVFAVTSLVVALLLMAVGPDPEGEPSVAADAFSRSAIGHHAFVETLRELEFSVLVSQNETERRAGKSAFLIVAEPSIPDRDLERWAHDERSQRYQRMLDRAGDVLIVLPKWSGHSHPEAKGWLASVDLIDEARAHEALEHAGLPDARVVRPEGEIGAPITFRDLAGAARTPPSRIEVTRPQLVVSSSLRPLIAYADGILLGEVLGPEGGEDRFLVLSDPDLLNNHGLEKADNAAVAIDVVRLAHDEGEPIIIDETLHDHGFAAPQSFFRALFEFPLVLLLIHLAATLCLFLWAGAGRFGSPLPVPPPIEPGKQVLIENTGELLRTGGHGLHILGRYFRAAVREVAGGLHAPKSLSSAELRDWLDRVGKGRGVSVGIRSLESEISSVSRSRGRGAHVVAAAVRVHRWKREMLDGR